jgi:hypothetical protein
MADVQILASGTLAAPLDYVIPGAQEILIKAMAATFDGTGAGTTWQPAITLLAPGGKEVGTFPVGSALAAGASADVAWFPRGGVNAAAGTSGIRYDVDNEGDWLTVEANGQTGAPPTSIFFDANNTSGGVFLSKSGGTGDIGILASNDGDLILEHSGLTGAVSLEQSGDGGMNIFQSGAGGMSISNSLGPFLLNHTGSGPLEIDLGAGQSLLVNNGTSGDVFRIDADGSLHGKTGQTLTFDL